MFLFKEYNPCSVALQSPASAGTATDSRIRRAAPVHSRLSLPGTEEASDEAGVASDLDSSVGGGVDTPCVGDPLL